MPLFFFIKDLISGTLKGIDVGMFIFSFISTILGLLFYKLQRNRLKFTIAKTKLTRDEIGKIVHEVPTDLKWRIFTDDKKIVEAKTFPSFFSGSWGEQITILFDDQRILVNSICDPDKQSSVVSMWRNKKNIT